MHRRLRGGFGVAGHLTATATATETEPEIATATSPLRCRNNGFSQPRQRHPGQVITDACIGWDDSVGVLQTLSDAVKARRWKRGNESAALTEPRGRGG